MPLPSPGGIVRCSLTATAGRSRCTKSSRCLKKWAVAAIASIVTVVAAPGATAVAQVQRFPDVPADHYAYEAVEWAAEVGVTTGYNDGTFKPQRPLSKRHAVVFMERYYDEILGADQSDDFTRGDMMVLLKAINDGTLRGDTPQDPAPDTDGAAQSQRFPDVPTDHYAFEAVEWAAEVGVTTGYNDGTFKPQRPLSKRHAVVFMGRYYDEILKAEESDDFTRGDMMVLLKAINDGTLRKPTVPSTPDIAINLMLLEDAEDAASSGTASLVAINRHGQKRVSADVWTTVSSPDGTRIAYTTWSEDQQSGGFHVVDADGTNTTKITDSPGGGEWSPDGTRITYIQRSEDGNVLYVVDADGTNATKITADSLDWGRGWSPDGARIAYVTWSEDGNVLHVVDADGTNATKITDSLDWHWVWSPDGTRIAYMTESDDGDSHALHVADADGTNTKKITDSLFSSGTARWDWSPDGTRIAYMTESDDGNSYTLHVADAHRTNTTKITDSLSPAAPWYWSPDGTRITYTTWSDVGNILHVADADGTNATKITDSGVSRWDWSPDGTSIVYAAGHYNERGSWETVIYVVDADGTNATKITDSPLASRWYWSSDGTRIAYMTRSEDRSDVLHVADTGGTDAVIELRSVRTLDESERGCEERFSMLRWSPNNEYLIYAITVSCRDDRVRRTINVVKTDGSYHSHLERAFALAWSPDSTRVVYLANEDGRVRVIEENIDDQRTTVLLDLPLVPLVVDCDFGIQSWIQWTSVGIYPAISAGRCD